MTVLLEIGFSPNGDEAVLLPSGSVIEIRTEGVQKYFRYERAKIPDPKN